jgi:ankyrin repeat protein
MDLCDCHGSTPLLVACTNGHWRLVGLLLDRGANLEHRDDSNWTALALASVAGHVDTVRILMERGAGALSASQSETSKGSRLVTPAIARAGVGRTGSLFTNSKDDSADNSAHVLSLMILELSSSLRSVTLGFGTQLVVVFTCILHYQATFRRTLPSHVGRHVAKIVTRARVLDGE